MDASRTIRQPAHFDVEVIILRHRPMQSRLIPQRALNRFKYWPVLQMKKSKFTGHPIFQVLKIEILQPKQPLSYPSKTLYILFRVV